jgi:two-component system, cell cycle sensor histidine kinase and response regulator CckA
MKLIKTFITPLLLVVVCGFLLRSAYVEVKNRAIDQLNNQQLVMAETAARGIESFFEHYSELLTHLSEMKEIASVNELGRHLMQTVYRTHANEIKGITRVNASGRIIYTFPEIPGAIGADLSSQKHIQRIMQTHKPVVSDVFDSVQGFVTIAFHIPVFEDGIFQGSLAVLIPFDQLSLRYLEPIKIGKDGYAWIISRTGVELYCPVPGHIGKSVFENCKDFPTILSMAQEMVKGNRGTGTYFFDRVRGDTVESVKKQAVYVPVQLSNTFWSIVVATPECEVLDIIQGFRDRWFLIVGVLMLATIVWTLYILRAFNIAQEEEKRKQAEEALRLSEKRLRRGEEVAHFGNWEFMMDRNEVEASDGAKTIYGLEGNIWSILDVQRVPLPEYRPLLDEALKELIVEGKPYNVDFKIRRLTDGKIIDIHSRAEYSSERRIVFGVIQDITERKRAEEALSQSHRELHETAQRLEHSRNMLQLVMESIPVRVFWKDKDLRYLGCNSLFAHDAGLSRAEELLGLDDFALGWREQAEIYRADDRKVMESGLPKLNIVEPQTTPTGAKIWLNTSKVPLHMPNGEVFGVLGVYEDITERKRAEEDRSRLEERLQRAEKMEALGTLSGGVAHDLNNVLGIVVGYSELLLDDLDESSPARSEALEIMKAGQRAAAIVQDLLTLARRGVSNRQVLNLNRIIMDCTKSPEFANLFSCHPNVRIRTDFEADLLNILGSSVHLAKSFLNLVSNAAEAMTNGGTLTIKTGNQYLDKPLSGYDEIRQGDYVVLSVSDTGEGISAENLKRIFEPFYTKKIMGRSGTGLGLAVVWGTVKDHHGYINVESQEGKGTTFILYFPVTREELSPDEVAISASEYMGKGESILVVDDVKEQRDLATMMLNKLNYKVSSVSGGEEAVEYIERHTVDLVVLDMIMEPGIDGLDTYFKLLGIRPSQKAIIVSGFAETERVIQAQELGAGAYVKKPYVLEKLGLAVRKELDRQA